jgi:hypothetical protein
VVKNEDFYVAIFEIVFFVKLISMNLNWVLNDFENILNCTLCYASFVDEV